MIFEFKFKNLFLRLRFIFKFRRTFFWYRGWSSNSEEPIFDIEIDLQIQVNLFLISRLIFKFRWTYFWYRDWSSNSDEHIFDIEINLQVQMNLFFISRLIFKFKRTVLFLISWLILKFRWTYFWWTISSQKFRSLNAYLSKSPPPLHSPNELKNYARLSLIWFIISKLILIQKKTFQFKSCF